MKRFFSRLFWLAVLVAALLAIRHSVLFVDETDYVVVTNFGQIVAVYDQPGDELSADPAAPGAAASAGDRGLHFKAPWHGVRRFDRRLQLFDPPAAEMVTGSRQLGDVSVVGSNLMVDCYVCWRIPPGPSDAGEVARDSDEALDERPVVRFLRTVRTPEGAQARLVKLVQSKLGAELANVQLSDLLSTEQAGRQVEDSSQLRQIGRRVAAELKNLASEAGIEIVDVEIKRLNLPAANREAVYQRQVSERKRIAEKYRSEGEAEKTKIESEARRQAETILAQAEAESQRVRGQGEAEATRIYAEAYSRDPEFYELVRTLEAYEQMLGKQTTLVLSSASRMLKLLSEGLPPDSSAPRPPAKTVVRPDARPSGDGIAPEETGSEGEPQ